jgi:peroxiredoxin
MVVNESGLLSLRLLLLVLVIAPGQVVDTTPPTVGAAAPAFSNVGANGETYSLESLKGKWIVLEWYNPSCPSTRQHYDSGAMPQRQREWTSRGVVWLSVSTTARIERATAFARSKGGAATAMLDDLETKTAIAYRAKTTPHMFVVDPRGVLIYNGAFDDRRESDRVPTPEGRNFVDEALTSAMAGRSVETPVTTPYGCAVPYER